MDEQLARVLRITMLIAIALAALYVIDAIET